MIIGFTCGTFDLFHAGHVLMLQEAREQCDYLVVGIKTDPTIDRPEKNKPIQSIVERQIQVSGCRFVDEVLAYETEKDLEEILKAHLFDIRFVGGDYKQRPQDITGKDINGIKIVFTSRNHDYSSSNLRKRVLKG